MEESADLIISVKEARKILGKASNNMSDMQIEDTIRTLDVLAKDALDLAKKRLAMKRDATELAELTYKIYKERKEPDK